MPKNEEDGAFSDVLYRDLTNRGKFKRLLWMDLFIVGYIVYILLHEDISNLIKGLFISLFILLGVISTVHAWLRMKKDPK
ncbi:hypothetical protein CEY16_14385 [Halalkalibacillus sediminis]|uniref:Uncharacterized protein n=1 Tax=Halalkalibacillus sediminis TaxID=2018042 RepID=A0A2I0QQD9_9BACI|nr:hypothetical protein [Halalkalibacillus sediminis]PKR76544.1 hypothetical protein CEY16_14385 [Halalkalibacillus sediminis]